MDRYVHSIKLTVPFGDVDMMGHVNNVRYLAYFETVRAEHLYNLAKGERDPQELGLILARAEIDYKFPAKWEDLLLVKMRTLSVGNSSWVYEYEIVNEKNKNRVIATGKTWQVAFDYKARSPIPIPQEFRERLLEEVEETKDL